MQQLIHNSVADQYTIHGLNNIIQGEIDREYTPCNMVHASVWRIEIKCVDLVPRPYLLRYKVNRPFTLFLNK